MPLDINFAAEITYGVVLLYKGRIVADGDAKKIMSDSRLMTEHGLEVPGQLKNIDCRTISN